MNDIVVEGPCCSIVRLDGWTTGGCVIQYHFSHDSVETLGVCRICWENTIPNPPHWSEKCLYNGFKQLRHESYTMLIIPYPMKYCRVDRYPMMG